MERPVAGGVTAAQRTSIELCWKHLRGQLGVDLDPERINYDLVESYIHARRVEGARGQSIRKERQALRRGMKIARRRGLINVIPSEWPKIRNNPPKAAQAGKLHAPEVLCAWLDSMRANEAGDAATQAELVLRTGLRATEARRMTLSWVEAAEPGAEVAGYLHLPAAAAKTRRARPIGLTAETMSLIDTLVAGTEPDQPLCPGNHKRAFKSAQERIGYDRQITLRDLRHCYASWAATGGDIRAVQAALGHNNLRTTERYLHSTKERTAATSLTVAARLSGHTKVGTPPNQKASAVGDSTRRRQRIVVEATGVEPTTSCVQSRCSPN